MSRLWSTIADALTNAPQGARATSPGGVSLPALAAAGIATWEWDAGRDPLRDSAGLRELYSIPADGIPLTLERLVGAVVPEDRDRFAASLAAAMAQSTAFRIEHRIALSSGSVRWLAVMVDPAADGVGAAARLSAVVRDVTVEREERTKLAELAARMTRITDLVPGTLYLVDLAQGRNVFANRELTAQLGYTPDEVQAMGPALFATLLHPEDFARVPARMATLQALPDGVVSNHEYRMRHRNGAWVWLESREVVFQRDTAGRPSHILGIASEVTERKELELRLRDQQERYRLLAENTRDVIARHALDGRYVWVSPSIAPMTGFAPEELIGRSPYDLIHPEDRARVRIAADAQSPEGAETETLTYRFRRKDGVYVWTECHISPIYDDAHHASGFLSVTRDVTTRHDLEERVRQSSTLHAMARLTGGIALDLNNALTVVRGNAATLLDDLDPAQDLEPLHEIERAVDRAAALARQLLAFGEREVGAPVVVAPDQVIRDTSRVLERLLGSEVHLQTQLDAAGAVVLADPRRLEQIIVDLALNAREAMPNGGSCEVRTSVVSLAAALSYRNGVIPAGDWVTVAVRDEGEGMTPETLGRLFEPFFTTKATTGRIGLGLATVRGLVADAGGHVLVESARGRGSTFTLWFPRTAAPQEQVAASPMIRKALILVVDDEDGVRLTTRRLLERAGYQVEVAASGVEALARIETPGAPAPALVLTDVMMPGMSGRDLGLRLGERRPPVPVAYVSGYIGGEISSADGVEGLRPLLEKPFRAADLLRFVGELLPHHDSPAVGDAKPLG